MQTAWNANKIFRAVKNIINLHVKQQDIGKIIVHRYEAASKIYNLEDFI